MKTSLTLNVAEGKAIIDSFIKTALKNGWDEDDLTQDLLIEYAQVLDNAMKAIGVDFKVDPTLTDEEEVEDECECHESEEITGEDEMESIIINVNGKRGLAKKDVELLVACVTKVMTEQFSGFPEKFLRFMIEAEACRIVDAYGVTEMVGE